MSNPTNILGKIGKKVGEELKAFRSTSDNTYATQVSLGNTDGQVSINSSAIVSLSTNIGNVSNVANATKVSLDNYRTGNYAFDDLRATRAEIGDLTVTGTTTTLNTQTVVVEDNIIEVNLKSDGSESAQTGGIQINRGEAVVSVTETLGNDITNFVATPNGDYLLVMTWELNGASVQFNVSNTQPTGSEVDSHIGKLQAGANWMTSGSGEYLNFDFDGNGNLTAIDTVEQTVGGGSTVRRIIGFNHVGGVEDKATIIWDDNTGQAMFKFGLGSSDADIKVKDVNASGVVAVSSGTSFTINGVDIGDYSEFTAGLTLGKS